MIFLRKIGWLASWCLLYCFLSNVQPSWGAEIITLEAADGYPLVALYEKVGGASSSQPAVVLLHMFKSKKESWQPLMTALKGHGVSSLAVDLRGHGASRRDAAGVDQGFRVEGRDPRFFNKMYQDGLAAVSWLQSQGHQKIGVVGASVGCSVAMHMVDQAKPMISAMVIMTPGRNYLGIDTLGHLDSWPGLPLLILTSDEEAGRGAEDIYQRLKGQGAELVIFEQESIHGTMMFNAVAGVEEQISRWLTRFLRP